VSWARSVHSLVKKGSQNSAKPCFWNSKSGLVWEPDETECQFQCRVVWRLVVWKLNRVRPKLLNQSWRTHVSLQLVLVKFSLIRVGLGVWGRQSWSFSRIFAVVLAPHQIFVTPSGVGADRAQGFDAAGRSGPRRACTRDVEGSRGAGVCSPSLRLSHLPSPSPARISPRNGSRSATCSSAKCATNTATTLSSGS